MLVCHVSKIAVCKEKLGQEISVGEYGVLQHVHKFFETFPFKRWSIIPLPSSMSYSQ